MKDCPNDESNGYGSHNTTHPLPCLVPACDCFVALRKDAERYRWLRDRCPWTMCSAHAVTRLALRLPIGYECHAEDKHDMDAAIDAAMAKETP